MPGQMLLNFAVSWNWLTYTRLWILIPVMFGAMTNENATRLLNSLN